MQQGFAQSHQGYHANSQSQSQGADRAQQVFRDKPYSVLLEKYFRRMIKFEGDSTKFRAWIFDLLVAIGRVDDRLAVALKQLMKRDELEVETFLPGMHVWIDQR